MGHNAIIDKDIQHGMGDSIARGGGSGLEVFNTIGIAKATLESDQIILCAIGHREDHTLLDRIVDKKFITPTDLGNFFREIYNDTIERLTFSKSKLLEDATNLVKREYNERLLSQEKLLIERLKQIQELKDNQTTFGKILVYVVIGIIIGVLFLLALR